MSKELLKHIQEKNTIPFTAQLPTTETGISKPGHTQKTYWGAFPTFCEDQQGTNHVNGYCLVIDIGMSKEKYGLRKTKWDWVAIEDIRGDEFVLLLP